MIQLIVSSNKLGGKISILHIFSCLMADVESDNYCKGISFARQGSSVSHLLYANYLIIFFKADDCSPWILNHTLDTFCDKARLSINV